MKNYGGFEEYRSRLDTVCGQYAGCTAVTWLNQDGSVPAVDHRELLRRVRAFGDFMERAHLREGDRIALTDTHMPALFLTFLAASYHHVTVAIMDAGLPTAELERLMETVDPRAVFTSPELYGQLGERVRSLWDFYSIRAMDGDYPLLGCRSAAGELPPTPDPDENCVAILFSSGTTSRMKPICISHNSVMMCSDIVTRGLGMSDKDRALTLFPLYHIAGLNSHMFALWNGIDLCMLERLDASAIQSALQLFQPEIFAMVPRVFDIMAQKLRQELDRRGAAIKLYYKIGGRISCFFQKRFGNAAVGRTIMRPFSKAIFGRNIHTCITGGAPFAPATAQSLLDMGMMVSNMYASTETGIPIVMTDLQDRLCTGAVGNVSHNPEVRIALHDADENGTGEIYVDTDMLMLGYFRDPELTGAAMDGKYFRTGDLGCIDEKGYLRVTGRAKESILLASGKKTSPADLEEVVELSGEFPHAVAFCGIPSEEGDFDEIHAFMESGGMDAAQREEERRHLLRFCAVKFPLYSVQHVHFIPEIPRTGIGKVKRYLLKETAAAEERVETPPESERESADPLARLCALVKRLGKVQREVGADDDLRSELGLDSLTVCEICLGVEEQFGVSVSEHVGELHTVRDVAAYIADHPAGASGGERRPHALREFPRKRTGFHQALAEFCCRTLPKLCRIEVSGTENIPERGAFILCPNHQSALDPLFVLSAMGERAAAVRETATMAKRELWDNPLTRIVMNTFGAIPVDRGGNTAAAMEHSLKWLRRGGNMLIFPEGTRARDGRLGAFKAGAALLSGSSAAPIVPVTIDGSFRLFLAGKLLPRFRDRAHRLQTVRLHFGEPIFPADESAEELMEKVRQRVEENLPEERPAA